MPDPRGEIRPIPDPQAEVERLARVRNILPRSAVGPGYTLRVYWEGGEGHARVTAITPDADGGFTITCERWEPGSD